MSVILFFLLVRPLMIIDIFVIISINDWKNINIQI